MTTWTPVAKQGETWTAEAQNASRVFDPVVFDNRPIFDTGPTSGLWSAKTKQAETWSAEAAP